MAYSEKVIDHYENPRNVGKMDADDPTVGTGMVGAPACGDVMRLQIKVEEGVITDAKFKTYGCGSAIASSSLATEWMKGKTLDQAAQITIWIWLKSWPCHRSKFIAAFWLRTPYKLPLKTISPRRKIYNSHNNRWIISIAHACMCNHFDPSSSMCPCGGMVSAEDLKFASFRRVRYAYVQPSPSGRSLA